MGPKGSKVDSKPPGESRMKHSKQTKGSRMKASGIGIDDPTKGGSRSRSRKRRSGSHKRSSKNRKGSHVKSSKHKSKTKSNIRESKMVFSHRGSNIMGEAGSSIQGFKAINIKSSKYQPRDREVDYNIESHIVKNSSSVIKQGGMDFHLDTEGGVSKTAAVPIFHYTSSGLHHDVWARNRTDQDIKYLNNVEGSAIRNSSMKDSRSEQDSHHKGSWFRSKKEDSINENQEEEKKKKSWFWSKNKDDENNEDGQQKEKKSWWNRKKDDQNNEDGQQKEKKSWWNSKKDEDHAEGQQKEKKSWWPFGKKEESPKNEEVAVS